MNEKVRAKALATLDGMEQIARNEMMKKVGYVSDEVDESKSDAICGGRKACLLGSAWIAYGVRPEKDSWGDFQLPGVGERGRSEFLRNRPALRAVYSALNEVAKKRLKRDPLDWDSAAEAYFENRERSLSRRVLVDFIGEARQRIETA